VTVMTDSDVWWTMRRFREAGVTFAVEQGRVTFSEAPDWRTRADLLSFVTRHHDAIRAILQDEASLDADRLNAVRWAVANRRVRDD
jgi:hypothetical protein